MKNTVSDSRVIRNHSSATHSPACKEEKAKKKKRSGAELMAEFYGIDEAEDSKKMERK